MGNSVDKIVTSRCKCGQFNPSSMKVSSPLQHVYSTPNIGKFQLFFVDNIDALFVWFQ